jgi:hypothetical protein
MKKIFLVILLAAFSTSMFAGWSTNKRNKCRWYAKKYAANAHVYSGLYTYQHDAGCGYAYAEAIKNCAWQKASRSSSGTWSQGAVYNNFCSRGERISLLESLLLPKNNSSSAGNIEEFSYQSNDEVFNEETHSIQINGISGFIKLQKGNGYYSNIRLSIWKPTDDLINFIEDEKMDDSEVLNQFEIRVTDKGVFFNGNLVSDELKSKFVITEINNEYFVKFDNVGINIPIDSKISLDDLAVRIDGDGAPDKLNNLTNAIADTESSIANNEFKLITFPNPTSSILNVEFSNNLYGGQTIIEIYNSTGEKVKDVFNGNLLVEELKTVQINLSDLINDRYFILIESNGKKLIKQIVKN